MTSEIRTNTIKNRVGLGTVSYTNTGIVVSGIVTANSFSGPFTGDLDVDGHTELDNTNIVGLVTVTNVSSGIGLKLIDSSSKQFFAGGGGGGTPFVGSFTGHDFRIQVGGLQNAIFKYAAGATGNFELGPSSGIGITFNGSTGNAGYAGIVTATTFIGALTGTASGNAVINNNADNRVITGGSGANLYGESGFTFDGTTVQIPDRINLNTNGTYVKENQLQFNPSGHAYIDHGTTAKDIYFRLSKTSALDTTMMQFDSDGEIIKFHKMISVGLQGGGDTATLGGGSGVGAQLTLKYADGSFNTRLLGNGNSYLNVNHGNLGVGIAVASKKLHVFKSNEHPVMLERGDTSNTIIELKTNGATRGYWGCSTTANFMVYDNDTSDVNFTVNQDGNVDIAGEVSTAQDYPNIKPTLDLNFAATKRIDSRFKYARSGRASFINEHGLLQIVNENEPRFDHDPITRECKGLLIEEPSTNIITYSNAPGMSSPNLGGNPQTNDSVNNITLPTGEKGTVRRYLANASGGGGRWGGYSGNSGVPKTGSVWVRTVSGTTSAVIDIADGGGKTVSITEEWQRVTTTYTPSNSYEFFDIYFSSPTTIYYWGVQIEESPFMTSYIPTNNASATRGGDTLIVDNIEDEIGYNQNEGTVIMDFSYTQDSDGAQTLFTFSGTSSNATDSGVRQWLRINQSAGTPNTIRYVQNSNDSDSSATVTPGVFQKIAFAYEAGDQDVSLDGTSILDTSRTPNTNIFRLSIGNIGWSLGLQSTCLEGHIKRFTYYPKKLPNSQLNNLTS